MRTGVKYAFILDRRTNRKRIIDKKINHEKQNFANNDIGRIAGHAMQACRSADRG